jgi:hypothetical protein
MSYPEKEKTPQQKAYDKLMIGFLQHLRNCNGLTKRQHAMHFHHGMYEGFTESRIILINCFPELVDYANNWKEP